MKDIRTLTIVVFAALGLLGGCLTLFLFNGISPAPVVVTTPILCAVIGVYAARPRFGWLYTILLVPLFGALNGVVNVLLTLHSYEYVLQGAWVGVICSVPFAPALLVMGWMTRRVGRARQGSLVAGVEVRRLSLVFAFIAAAGGVFVARQPFHPVGSGIVAAVVGVAAMVIFGVRGLMTWMQVEELGRLATFLRPTHGEAPVMHDEKYVDIGLGDTHYVYVEPSSLLRGAPVARLLIEGDPARALPIVRNAAVLAGACVFMVLGVLLSLLVG